MTIHILRKEIGVKTLISKGWKRINRKYSRGIKQWLKRYLPDILLTAAIIAGVFYVYGINTATVYGYKASDIPVHNLWVNEMDNNNILQMVCILMAFIVLFIICMQHLEYKHIFYLEYFQLYRRCLSISCFCFRLG